jgi:hypothetical protein
MQRLPLLEDAKKEAKVKKYSLQQGIKRVFYHQTHPNRFIFPWKEASDLGSIFVKIEEKFHWREEWSSFLISKGTQECLLTGNKAILLWKYYWSD